MQIDVCRLRVDIHTNGLKSRLSQAGRVTNAIPGDQGVVYTAFINLLLELATTPKTPNIEH